MGLKQSLVAHWRLEEAAGATRADSVGTNNLTDVGTVAQTTGKIGNGINVYSSDAKYLTAVDSDCPNLSMGDVDFTIAAWVQLYATPASSFYAVSKGLNGANNNEYILGFNGATQLYAFIVANNTNSTTVNASDFGLPPTSTWAFVVAWHDSVLNTINICVNNGTVNSVARTGGSYDSTNAFNIGGINSGSVLWNGLIDEVSVWRRVLTAAEIAALYNGGNGLPLGAWAGGSQVIWF